MQIASAPKLDEVLVLVGGRPPSFPDYVGDFEIKHAVLVFLLNLISVLILGIHFLPVGLVLLSSILILLIVGYIFRQRIHFPTRQPLLLSRFWLPINGLIVSKLSI